MDELLPEAKQVAIQHGFVSIANLQRKMRIGYTRAARLADLMVEDGFCEKEYNIYGHRKLRAAEHLLAGDVAMPSNHKDTLLCECDVCMGFRAKSPRPSRKPLRVTV